jgi:hypothetical protein
MTAREFLISKRLNGWANHTVVAELMVDFAKYHVELALKAASENAELQYSHTEYLNEIYVIDKESILTSYPLENIN